jgi:hypothetical protein
MAFFPLLHCIEKTALPQHLPSMTMFLHTVADRSFHTCDSTGFWGFPKIRQRSSCRSGGMEKCENGR